MSAINELTSLETHFAFGKNWASFAAQIGDAEIDQAVAGLSRFFADDSLVGKRLLDIGCGSGLHSLAALRLGAAEVVGVDLDPDSVETARAVLGHHAPEASRWSVQRASVFDLDPAAMGAFDVVYSWGVLHDTGDMMRAIRQAATLVKRGGLFVFALYRKTWLCPFWKWEKRWYAHASAEAQKWAQKLYVALFRVGLWMTGRTFTSYVANYTTNRGMDFYHDVHDWLGGYPYESISPDEVESYMQSMRYKAVRQFLTTKHQIFGRQIGYLGTGCDEYVYRRDGK